MSEEMQELGAAVEEKIKAAKSGASWFYWIAALSIINSVVVLSGSEWGFVIGLGITQIMDGLGMVLAERVGPVAKIVFFVFALVAAGVTALFGYLGCKLKSWAFVVGMVLYALDGLLVLAFMDWVGAAFHAFALYCIFMGFKHCQELNALAAQLPQTAPAQPEEDFPAAPQTVETS